MVPLSTDLNQTINSSKFMKTSPNPDQIQQGDVTLELIDKLPEGVKVRPRSADGTVNLSMGSRGGHRHYFDSPDITVFDGEDGQVFAQNLSPETIELKHTATHKPLYVKPGVHRVGGLNEMDHVAKMKRQVVD